MANPAWCFAVRGEGSESLEIDIYDDIGESWWGDSVSAKSVRTALKEAKNAKTIKLRVNSRGGDVIDGFAIYNLLNEHSARVEVDVDALAASIASVIIMAADEIRIAKNAFVMIHDPWSIAMGGSEDLRGVADVLDKMRDQIADAYVARTGQTREKVIELMAAETYLTADEAKALGFADTVKPAKKGKQTEARARAFASLNLGGLDSVPEALRRLVESSRESLGGALSPVQTENSNPPSDAEAQETDAMDEIKPLLAALGATSIVDALARAGQLTRLENAAGKSGDEAHGLVLAFKASHEKLPGVQAALDTAQKRIGELETQAEGQQLDAAFAQASTEHKLTPAIEKSLRDQYAAGDITLKGATACLAALTPIAALANAGKSPTAPGAAASGATSPAAVAGAAPTWNGKTFDALKPMERHELAKAEPDLYKAMRATAKVTRK